MCVSFLVVFVLLPGLCIHFQFVFVECDVFQSVVFQGVGEGAGVGVGVGVDVLPFCCQVTEEEDADYCEKFG